MKFSFSLIKKLVPSLKSPQQLADVLTMHLFEVEGIEGDTIDVKVLANRYSDAASHWGIARVIAAALGKTAKIPMLKATGAPVKSSTHFSVEVKDAKLCPRYSARYFDLPKFYLSPPWLKATLATCGIKSVNAVVDIMNYVMLEIGEPMHAFDAGKIVQSAERKSQIVIRRAKKGEKMETLDGSHFELTSGDLVIAGEGGPLAVAGIKGGKRAEITPDTKRILIEAATFDQTTIYKTSRRLKLSTDASLRFSHGLSTALVPQAIARATELLEDVCGAIPGDWIDIENAKPRAVTLKFDIDRFNRLTGLNLTQAVCLDYLKRLGFGIKGNLVTAPLSRTDISIFEDLVEEVVALYGVNRIPSAKPMVALAPPEDQPLMHLKDRIRRILPGLGLTEVMNYAFANRGELAIENPIAEDKGYLRDSLASGFIKNIEDNLRFFDAVRIFEIGHVFTNTGEKEILGVALGSKKDSFVLELKGVIETLLLRLGVRNALMVPMGSSVIRVETETHEDLGVIRLFRKRNDAVGSIAELDLEALFRVVSEKEFTPIPKYPAVVRDISIVVSKKIKTGDLLEAIEKASDWLKDGIEVVDFYEGTRLGEGNQGMTFRLPFRSDERTLTDKEIDEEVKKIVEMLRDKFSVRIR